MLEFLVLLFLSTTFAYFSKLRFKYGLEIAFILITIFAAIRYNFGNDYVHYLDGFNFYTSHHDLDSVSDLRTEIGWFYLIFIFKDWGFPWLIAVLSIVEQLIMYYFIKKYVDKDVYWIAVFTYLISTGLFLTNLSMIRQAAAISICMVGFEFAIRRKLYISIALVILASLIHASAWFILPLICFVYYLYGRINISNTFILVNIILLLGIQIFARYIPLNNILSLYGTDYIDRYGDYLSVVKNTSYGISSLVSFFILFMVLLYQKRQTIQNKYIVLLVLIGCYIEALGTSIYLLDRVALYFTCFIPICYSMTFKIIRKYNWFPMFILFFIILKLYNYYSFISTGWGQSFRNYHTIFDI